MYMSTGTCPCTRDVRMRARVRVDVHGWWRADLVRVLYMHMRIHMHMHMHMRMRMPCSADLVRLLHDLRDHVADHVGPAGEQRLEHHRPLRQLRLVRGPRRRRHVLHPRYGRLAEADEGFGAAAGLRREARRGDQGAEPHQAGHRRSYQHRGIAQEYFRAWHLQLCLGRGMRLHERRHGNDGRREQEAGRQPGLLGCLLDPGLVSRDLMSHVHRALDNLGSHP